MKIRELIFEAIDPNQPIKKVSGIRDEDFEIIDIINILRREGADYAKIMRNLGWTRAQYDAFLERVKKHGVNLNPRNIPSKISKNQQQYNRVKELILTDPNISLREIVASINEKYGSGTISKKAARAWMEKIKKELNIPLIKIDQEKLASALIKMYDPSQSYIPPPTNWVDRDKLPNNTSDMQLLERIRAIAPEYREVTLTQMLSVLKLLAYKGKLTLNRNPGPPALSYRFIGTHDEKGMPREPFYDPMLTPLENGIVGMARNGNSNEVIANEWRDPEVDEDPGTELGSKGRTSVTPVSVATQLAKIRLRLGIEIPKAGATPAGQVGSGTLRERILLGLMSGQTLSQLADTIDVLDRKSGTFKTASEKLDLFSVITTRERTPYRTQLAKELGRAPTPKELNEVLPEYLKLSKLR